MFKILFLTLFYPLALKNERPFFILYIEPLSTFLPIHFSSIYLDVIYISAFATYLFCRIKRNERSVSGAISSLPINLQHWMLWHLNYYKGQDH